MEWDIFYNTMFKNRSIRFRFVFIFTLFLLAFLCTFAFLVYTLLAHKINENIQKSLLFAVQQSEQSFFDRHGNFHLHEKAREHQEIMHFIILGIYDLRGCLLYSSHDLPKCLPVHSPAYHKKFIETHDGNYLYYTDLLMKNAEKRYLIRAFYFQQNEKSDLKDLRNILLALIVFSIFACAIGGLYFASRLLLPFRLIADEASRISVENLNERLPYYIAEDEVGKLCLTLNGLFSRLHASFEALKRFTSDASHELKTPLTIMRGDIEVLLRKKRSPEEYEETLHYTIKEIDRMIRLSNGLLLLAKAEGKKAKIEKNPFSLTQIVEEVLEYCLRSYKGEKQISVTANINKDISVLGNQDWIQQMIENLLVNALQYTPNLGCIEIVLSHTGKHAQFIISNTGPGIPKEHLPHIFERFYRIDQGRTRKQGGFGLGLSICKALTEAHQGKIHVTSIPGEKTTFSILLPLFSDFLHDGTFSSF
ncbi:MAG: hypothetical protein HUU50_01095 [Candidatus Brocadiae bacterium]|nr:hypothetical protein [Candidatus Brocadiia bacterium]